jgi:hypothetical protein
LWHYLLASRCFASASFLVALPIHRDEAGCRPIAVNRTARDGSLAAPGDHCRAPPRAFGISMTRANRWRYKSEPETVSERSGHSDYLRVLRVSALHLRFHSCFGWNRPMPGPEDPRASERKNVRDTTRANSKARSRMGPTPPDRHNRAATSLPRNPQRPYHAATSNGGNHALDRPARTPSRHPCPQHHAHRARTANTVRRRADDREHPTPSVTQKPRSSRRPTVRLITPKRHQHWTQR